MGGWGRGPPVAFSLLLLWDCPVLSNYIVYVTESEVSSESMELIFKLIECTRKKPKGRYCKARGQLLAVVTGYFSHGSF